MAKGKGGDGEEIVATDQNIDLKDFCTKLWKLNFARGVVVLFVKGLKNQSSTCFESVQSRSKFCEIWRCCFPHPTMKTIGSDEVNSLEHVLPQLQQAYGLIWELLAMDSIKVKFDATYNQFTKKAIVGIVVRNNERLLMAAGTYPYKNVLESTVAEVTACRSAVVLAKDQGNRATYIIAGKGRRFNELWVWVEEAR
ncbi:hypothetical protein Godav_029010, partial [Gossypium davidsonii]|nr:hypothetical protein [Gossypium davidsonii]